MLQKMRKTHALQHLGFQMVKGVEFVVAMKKE